VYGQAARAGLPRRSLGSVCSQAEPGNECAWTCARLEGFDPNLQTFLKRGHLGRARFAASLCGAQAKQFVRIVLTACGEGGSFKEDHVLAGLADPTGVLFGDHASKGDIVPNDCRYATIAVVSAHGNGKWLRFGVAGDFEVLRRCCRQSSFGDVARRDAEPVVTSGRQVELPLPGSVLDRLDGDGLDPSRVFDFQIPSLPA
jgi:hypothetical protein